MKILLPLGDEEQSLGYHLGSLGTTGRLGLVLPFAEVLY